MTRPSARYHSGLLLMVFCVELLGAGCSRWMEVQAVDPASDQSDVRTGPVVAERVPVVLTSIAVSQNGSAVAPATDLERRVLDSLAETQLFSRLVYPRYSDTAPDDQHVRAKLSVALFPEPHAGAAAWKGIVIGASMFLLAPVLPLEYEYGARMTLDLEQGDGDIHRYTVSAEGVAHYHLFGATHLAVDELKARILETCLTQLQRELVKDRMFVQAGYLAKHRPDPRRGTEFTAIPATAPVHRPPRAISILRASPQ